MQLIGEMICLSILLFLSYVDIRTHEIPISVLILGAGGAVFYHIFSGEISWWEITGGIGVGVFFLVVSRITREGMGYGDSLGILVLGEYLGIRGILMVLADAFFILGLFSMAVLCMKRMSKKCVLPFFPFLTCGYVLMVLTKGRNL